MYRLLWRVLPGNLWAKIAQSAALFMLVVTALFLWGFPWFVATFLTTNVTVN